MTKHSVAGARGYGHLVKVTSWTGDETDDELWVLGHYLAFIADEPDLRRVEKRGWRSRLALAATDLSPRDSD